MSEETLPENDEVESIGDLVEVLSLFCSVVTVETKYLHWDEPVCVLRCMCEIPEEVESVRLPHLGKTPVMARDRFCWCDEVSSLILYQEEGVYGEDDEGISVEEGVTLLDLYIKNVVQKGMDWDEFENEYLVS
jgi:hypothetical protein